MLLVNDKGQAILLYRILLYQIKEHSVYILLYSVIPVQVFAHTALLSFYFLIKKINKFFN
jgi:hypothetical protein